MYVEKNCLTLPCEAHPPKKCTVSLDDLFKRVKAVLDFLALNFLSLVSPIDYGALTRGVSAKDYKLRLPGATELPNVRVIRGRPLLEIPYTDRLFSAAVTQLVTAYEKFLEELARELFVFNTALVPAADHQLTVRQILDYGDIEELRNAMIESHILGLMMKSYPKQVSAFQKDFHIGLHDRKSPCTEHEVHAFVELRNIVVHSDGKASRTYLQRTKDCRDVGIPYILEKEGDSPQLNFVTVIAVADKLLQIGVHADTQARKQWDTSVSKLPVA